MNKSAKRGRDRSTAIIVATLLAAIVGFGTVYWTLAPPDNAPVSQAENEVTGQPAGGGARGPLAGLNKGPMATFVAKPAPQSMPDVEFSGPSGEKKTFADWKGKVVLLNLWATWCIPCREEMPMLDKLEQELGGNDFEVVAVNIERNAAEKAKRFLDDTGAKNLRLYTDPIGKMFSVVKAIGMPTTLLIARDGKEMGRLVGPADWGSPEAIALIKAAIASSPSS